MSRRKVDDAERQESLSEVLKDADGVEFKPLDVVQSKTEASGNPEASPGNHKPRSTRNVEYLVCGTDAEGAEIVICSFPTLHQLRKYYLPLSGAFRHSYRNIRWLKAKCLMGG